MRLERDKRTQIENTSHGSADGAGRRGGTVPCNANMPNHTKGVEREGPHKHEGRNHSRGRTCCKT